MELLFWVSVIGVLYPYLGYPLLLYVAGRVSRAPQRRGEAPLPSVTMIIPAHNEAGSVAAKVANTAALRYPLDRLQILFVSDGSTDGTAEVIRSGATSGMSVLELPERRGKAAALNAGIERAAHDIIVFSDASIALEPDALRNLVRPFQDAGIGCVSGEDPIADGGGEGLYGRYELFLRRLESRLHSIVGASGSFYAQRRVLCGAFEPGLAPDFLSVLRTVEQGYRAVSEPSAVGSMTSLKDPRQEFERKVRTVIRGLTTLFRYKHLLSPLRFGWFSVFLASHKLLRWTVPVFLASCLATALALRESAFYIAVFAIQVAFYLVAAAAFLRLGGLQRSILGKIAVYFSSVNAAVLVAWIRYARGVRQELWTPSRR